MGSEGNDQDADRDGDELEVKNVYTYDRGRLSYNLTEILREMYEPGIIEELNRPARITFRKPTRRERLTYLVMDKPRYWLHKKLCNLADRIVP